MHATGTEPTPDAIAPLLLRVANGERNAFETLYRDTSATLLGICLRVLHDRNEAEDVLQEVYVAVWTRAGQFDRQRARAMTWLGSIARNRAIDRLRARPAAAHVSVETCEIADEDAPSPAAGAEAAQAGARLDDCLAQLDANRRTLIRAAFFDNLTYDALANRVGAPLGTVKSWIRRGLSQLKACLER